MDTIRLWTPKGRTNIKDHPEWQITCRNGTEVKREATVCLNKDIEGRHNGTLKLVVNSLHQNAYLSVSSIPVLLNGTSLRPPTQLELSTLPDVLYNITSDYIDMDIDCMSFSRLDNADILYTSKPVDMYINAIKAMTTHKIGHYKVCKEHDGYVRFYNDQISVIMYNKAVKAGLLKSEHHHLLNEITNWFRIEVQNKTPEKISQEIYKNLKVSHLCQDWLLEKMLKQRQKEFDKCLHIAKKESDLYSGMLDVMQKATQRSGMLDGLFYHALHTGMTLDQLKGMMQALGYTRQHIHKMLKKAANIEAMKYNRMGLIDELRTLIYAA
jgi:hypothetical protein